MPIREVEVTYLVREVVTYVIHTHDDGDEIHEIEDEIRQGNADTHPQVEAVRSRIEPGATRDGMITSWKPVTPEEYEVRFGF